VSFLIVKLPPYRILSKKILRLPLVLSVIIHCAALAHAVEPGEWSLLSQGQVVVKQNISTSKAMPSVEARILVSTSPEKAWPVVANPEVLMSEERRVKRVKILSQEGNRQAVAFSVLMTHLLPTFNYTLEQNLHPPNLVRFHRLSGSFQEIQGFWRLIPAENGRKTILVYNLKMDAGPLIPRSLLLSAVKADLPNMLQNAKRAIEQNAN
jgi:ribosome-associated toxin RatA of RatAB toxin-antitoxin module